MVSTNQIILVLCIGGNVQSIPQLDGMNSFYRPNQHMNFISVSNRYENIRPRNQWAGRNAGRSQDNDNGFESSFLKREPSSTTKPFDPFNPNNPGYSSNTNTQSNSNQPETRPDQTISYKPSNSGQQNSRTKPYGETKSGVRYELDSPTPINPADRPSNKPNQKIPKGKFVQNEDQIYNARCYRTSVVLEYRMACSNYQKDFRPLIQYDNIRGTGKLERAKEECNMLKEAGVDIECKFS